MFKYVCGGAAAIYGGHVPGELQDFVAADPQIVQPDTCGVICTGTVFGPVRYRWPLEETAYHGMDVPAADLVEHFRISSHQTAPSVQIMRIDQATVFNNAIYCGEGAGQRILYETFRGCEWRSSLEVGIPVHDHVDGPDLTDDRFLDVYFGAMGYFNYGHWLVDELPKFRAIEILLASSDKPIRLILPGHDERLDAIRRESIRLLLGDSVQTTFVSPREPWGFSQLHYVSPVSYHPVNKSPIALDYLVGHTLARASALRPDISPGQARRVFAARGSIGRRRLLNEDAVRARLAMLDFQFVDSAALSFADQAIAFSQASVVVGQMGAAMTNTLFCRPTTAVIHLAPPLWREPFYLDLAATRGHRYQVLFGIADETDAEPQDRDFAIDLDTLEAIINAL